MNGDDWKAGFQAALADYFWAQKFFVYDDNVYGGGQDYDATLLMRLHLVECSVDRIASDHTADFKEEQASFFQDTDADNLQKTFVTALLTCKCGQLHGVRVALEDSLSNAIKWVTR